MTRRIDINISGKVYLPDDVPVADYLRAVANHLADVLPAQAVGDDATVSEKTWRAGREVGITVTTAVVSVILQPIPSPDPAPEDFDTARWAELRPQGSLL